MQLKQTIPIALTAALAYAQDDSDSGSGSSGMMVCPANMLPSVRD